MALESTQPLIKMSTRNFPGGEGRPARKDDNIRHQWADCLENMGGLATQWASMACYRDSFTFLPVVFTFIG
jgi:hypothetical protein